MKRYDRYKSRNGYIFEIIDIAKDGQDCSIDMVIYVNLTSTKDHAPGQIWVTRKDIFESKMTRISGAMLL